MRIQLGRIKADLVELQNLQINSDVENSEAASMLLADAVVAVERVDTFIRTGYVMKLEGSDPT